MYYLKQANDFAKKHGVTLKVHYSEYRPYFPRDKQSRYVFKLTLKRGRKQYTSEFGQSIAAGAKEPTMYDILSCLTKYDPETFEDFCSEFGYDTDSRNAEKIYKAARKEYAAVERLFSDCMDELCDIQ